jgi:hypothetical protein
MNLAAAKAGGAKSDSFFTFLKNMQKERGFLSLYQGLQAGIVRQIFYATSRFGLFEVIRDYIAHHRETDIYSRLFSGCTSGGLAALISCPAEVTLVRMSNDSTLPVDQRRNYKGVFNAFQRILAEEGVQAFFRGSGPFVNRAMLVGAVQVGTFDQFKATFKSLGVVKDLPNVFCASMSSGILYSVITMPMETAKNRMAFQKADPNTGNSFLPHLSLTDHQLRQTSLHRNDPNSWLNYLQRGTIETVARFSSLLPSLWWAYCLHVYRSGVYSEILFEHCFLRQIR